MGLDELNLRVLATASDNPVERMRAQKVLKLMSKGRHWVLVVRKSEYLVDMLNIFAKGSVAFQRGRQRVVAHFPRLCCEACFWSRQSELLLNII